MKKTNKIDNLFLIGEGYLRVKKYQEAFDCFLKIKKYYTARHHSQLSVVIADRLKKNIIACAYGFFEKYDFIKSATAFEIIEMKIPRNKFIELATDFIVNHKLYQTNLGNAYEKAFNAYDVVSCKKGLISCGNYFLSVGNFELTIKAFQTAKVLIPKKKFIAECDKRFPESWDFEKWMKLYKVVHAQPSKEVLIAFADNQFVKGRLKEALPAYTMAGIKPAQEKLIVLGNKNFDDKSFDSAIQCFQLVGQGELVKLGDRLLQDNPDKAFKAYKLAKDIRGLIKCAERAFSWGGKEKIDLAVLCYKTAKVELPRADWIKKADRYLDIDFHTDDALYLYKITKHKLGIMKCGDRMLEKGYGGHHGWTASQKQVEAKAKKIYAMATKF